MKMGIPLRAAPIISALITIVRATSFDGQYIQPNLTNNAVEWWWGSAVGTPAPANVGTPGPVLQFLFYQGTEIFQAVSQFKSYLPKPTGYPILADLNHTSLPEYYIDINGFFGGKDSDFTLTVPASSGEITEGDGKAITGTWGTVGTFQTSSDLKTMRVTFNASDITGSINFISNRGSHFGCNVTDGPFFNAFAPKNRTLNEAEQVFFDELGWPVSIPGGIADVDVTINGTRLAFSGNGYHDQNFMSLALNEFISSWYFGFAEVGPYTFSYVSATPVNSSIVFNTGYLATDQAVLQNQCSINGTKTTDISLIQPKGEMEGPEGTITPSSWILSYVLDDGSEFEFELKPTGANPNLAIYQRWTGSISGGKKGEEIYEGVATFEWLNPGLNPYSPA
ncbi:hypothetical protein D9757_000285 [Collybiopsis confluens]|uniref:Uncharacterized protein n=1 Tax=Collybiopsis confluens TaxID=2823264 RepID=A0A8H5I2A3_9AGAR|nr:hypothetical protein D9757_000285 [Collybiopsis confluens]